MTSPRPLTRAPPELPGEIGASVWMRSTRERMPCAAERAADRHRQLADLRQGLLEGGRLEVLAVDLDDRQVGAGVGGPDRAGDAAAVEEGDLDPVHHLVLDPD